MPHPKGHITEATLKKIARVQKIMLEGEVTFAEACRVVGINMSHYRKTVRKLRLSEK